MIDVQKLTIRKATDALKNKEFSVKELVQSCLTNIENKNTSLNAVLTVNEDALSEAEKLDSSALDFDNKPLLGMPIMLKDAFSTKGLRTSAASKVLDNYIPPFDATAVKKLKEAGAIIIGKANMDAWAHGSSGENSDYGPAKNPYDETRTPGGSSSGSAVALPAGMALASTGTDTGGSIRLPASFTNTVGLKPTYGRVSRYGIIAMGSSFDSIGHFTKDVYDNALMLSVTAGHDVLDGTTSAYAPPQYTSTIKDVKKPLRIGVVKEFNHNGADPKVDYITQQAIKTMEGLGAEIIEVSLPHVEYAIATYYILIPAEVSSNLGRMTGTRYGHGRDMFTDEAKRRIMIGTYTLSAGYYDAYYNKALKVRTLIKQDFDKAFEKVDALLCPVSPTLPFKLGEKANDPLAMYLSDIFVAPMNLAGVPALSVPAGHVDGLPVGVQFVTKQFDEELLFQVAYQFEQAREHQNPSLRSG